MEHTRTWEEAWFEFCKLGGLHATEEAQVMEQRMNEREAASFKRGLERAVEYIKENSNSINVGRTGEYHVHEFALDKARSLPDEGAIRSNTMTIAEFIEKAIKGGWTRPTPPVDFTTDVRPQYHLQWAEMAECQILLDPLAWQAVEKTQLKSRKESAAKWGFAYWENDIRIDAYAWFMHRMIDALAEGKSIEEFLATL